MRRRTRRTASRKSAIDFASNGWRAFALNGAFASLCGELMERDEAEDLTEAMDIALANLDAARRYWRERGVHA